jgi:exodeoxyribonuclease V alpha subunit
MKRQEISLSTEQEQAIEMCLDSLNRIFSVTGRAGTGKTSVLGIAYEETVTQVGRGRVVLCAPTGRAAKRIQELTGIQAKTIHKLLEFPQPDESDGKGKPISPDPKRNRQRPLNERVVYVDESSMVSQQLYEQLMAALPANGRIRFFGDNEQLPPVDKGSPFEDLLKTKPFKRLTRCFRSDDEILFNAERIRVGRLPVRNDRFEIIYTDNPIRQLIAFTTKEVTHRGVQIIMPTRNGNYGTNRVNPSLQLKFNPTGDILRVDRKAKILKDAPPPIALRGGDKFLWNQNDYQLKLFNGDLGYIDWVNSEDGSLQISTDDRQMVIPPFIQTYSPFHGSIIHYDPRKKIELGYAVTTHKAQGSEFDTVIYCMTNAAPRMLNRRNLYTGITRARHNVIIICDRMAMTKSMRRYISGG